RRRGSYRMAQAGDLPGAVGDPINMGRARYEVLPGGELPPVDLPQADVTDGAAGSGEPIDLDRLLADEAGDLPPPRDDAPLEPIPAGDSYYDGGDAGAPSYRADCPECRERSVTGKPTPAAAYAGRNQPCQDCGDPWCGPSCNPASRRGPYGRVEYLLWWADGFDTPPLVTTNDVPGNAPALGQDGTRTVYGGELLDGSRNGLRLSGGYWFDDQRDLALEFDWLLLETESDLYAFSDPTGTSVLGRPFYNVAPVINGVVQPPASDAQLVSFPGTVGGDLDIYARTEFTSLGIRARTGLCCREIGGGCDPCACNGCRDNRLGGVLGVGRRPTRPDGISRVDATVGYRFARLQDHLGFRESLTDLAGGGGAVEVNEAFDTSNEFHGLDLGVVYDWQTTRWGLELVGRVALGSTEQQVRIRGENRVGVPGGAGVTTPGGLLAQTSNIGVYERDRFSVLPELSARLSYRVTPRLSLSAAYTLLYWANVVRPGDQIDFSVDGRLASGALVAADPLSHPRFDLEETSYWAHGLSFGADYRY
ncbi:MAG: BBP7 family outer membrane beta-barrel protein, partial [Planctomycetota bacterium]